MVDVILTSEAEALARKHRLSQHMVYILALAYGGWPMADMRTHPALVRRGLCKQVDEGYRLTTLGKELCAKMFVKRHSKVFPSEQSPHLS